jgi:predicted ATPase
LTEHFSQGLQIAACLGPTFDSDSFAKADSNSGLSPDDFFHMVTESGFIQEQESAPGHYTWCHEKVREAAYSLIPVRLLESLHLLVGTRIYIKTKEEQIADKIFVIVRNMNMGLRCLDAENLKVC